MQVKCPHCGNQFASERTGRQFCPSCGQQIDVGAEPVVPGAGGAPAGEPIAEGEPTPWEKRAQLGLFGGFVETVKQVCLSPEMFWKKTQPKGALWDAIAFAWICQAISGLLSVPLALLTARMYMGLLSGLAPSGSGGDQMRSTLMRSFAMGGGTVGAMVLRLVLAPVFMVIGAGILHLVCMMLGCAKNGFDATLRSTCYATAPLLLGWIPFVNFAATVYSLVLLGMGIAWLQRTTPGKAAAVVLIPALGGCCCMCCGIAATAGALAPMLGKMR